MSQTKDQTTLVLIGAALLGGAALYFTKGGNPFANLQTQTPEADKYGVEACRILFRMPISTGVWESPRLHISRTEATLTIRNIANAQGQLQQAYRRVLSPDLADFLIVGDVRALARTYQLAYSTGVLHLLTPSLHGQTTTGTHGLSAEFRPTSPNLDKIMDAMLLQKLDGNLYGRNGKMYTIRDGAIQSILSHSLKGGIVRIDWLPQDSAWILDFDH